MTNALIRRLERDHDRLIAAAPELLYAAKRLVAKLHQYEEEGLDVPGEIRSLEEAIYRAEVAGK